MFDKQTLLWVAAAIAAAYYLWPTVRGWFSRPAAADMHELVIPASMRSFEMGSGEDAFDALLGLRDFYVRLGLTPEQIATLLEPHLPHLLRTPLTIADARRQAMLPPPQPAPDPQIHP